MALEGLRDIAVDVVKMLRVGVFCRCRHTAKAESPGTGIVSADRPAVLKLYKRDMAHYIKRKKQRVMNCRDRWSAQLDRKISIQRKIP